MEANELDDLVVIANPTAGPARGPTLESVVSALAAEGARSRIRVVPPADVSDAAREAARGGRMVGVAGGDGTLSSAAGAIAEAGGVLAPIPLGTRNHFARRLGIDSLYAAARALSLGHVARVPLGSVNGRTFINHASAGLYPRLVHHRERIRRWTGKPAAQVLAGLYSVLRLQTMTLGLHVNGLSLERTVPGLWVGLGRGAFRLPVDGHAPGGRNLEVLVPGAASRLELLAAGILLFWRLRRGQPPDVASVEVIHAPAFTLEATHAIDLSRDGEVDRGLSPIEFRMHPHALRVLSLVHADGERWVA
jgi:diacylglycerol kinase family enzyme